MAEYNEFGGSPFEESGAGDEPAGEDHYLEHTDAGDSNGPAAYDTFIDGIDADNRLEVDGQEIDPEDLPSHEPGHDQAPFDPETPETPTHDAKDKDPGFIGEVNGETFTVGPDGRIYINGQPIADYLNTDSTDAVDENAPESSPATEADITDWTGVNNYANHPAGHDASARGLTDDDIESQRYVHPVPESAIKDLLGSAQAICGPVDPDQPANWISRSLEPRSEPHRLGDPLLQDSEQKNQKPPLKVHVFPTEVSWHVPTERKPVYEPRPPLLGVIQREDKYSHDEIVPHPERAHVNTQDPAFDRNRYQDPDYLAFLARDGGHSIVMPHQSSYDSSQPPLQKRAVIEMRPTDSRHSLVSYTVWGGYGHPRSGPEAGALREARRLFISRSDFRMGRHGPDVKHYIPDTEEVSWLNRLLSAANRIDLT